MRSCFCVWADRIPPCLGHPCGFHGHEVLQPPQTRSADVFPSATPHGRGWHCYTEKLGKKREPKSQKYIEIRWKIWDIMNLLVISKAVRRTASRKKCYFIKLKDKTTFTFFSFLIKSKLPFMELFNYIAWDYKPFILPFAQIVFVVLQ